jgi:DNA gyrase subunit A
MADEKDPQQLPLPPDGGGGPPGPGALNIQPINIEEEMRRSYLDYSMSVIIGRALPDVRDGLKPVHRRILYAMQGMGLAHNKKHVKCAKVVGQVLGLFHPHGDTAVYDSMVRMAQDFSLRYPLVDGQGNFGSVDGDPPAAMRYTECRMAHIGEEMLADIDKDTVDFQPNYDESTTEPVLLPARIPNLLVNGSDGIAVGMATKIPPHNLTEIVEATITLVNEPATQLKDILKIVKGPDFPTGAFIHGKSGIAEAYKNGRGRFMMRAKAAIENLAKERQAIVITEIPYQVNKARLIERIAELVNDKVVDDVSDIRDESDRDGMRIVIELKRGGEPQLVLNQLYKHTQMQESFSMIFLAVVNGQPKEMGLIQAIQHFIDHREEVVRRRTAYLLARAKEREHILEGYKIALDNLDAVIKLIRASKSRLEAREGLIERFKLSQRQSDAILDLQLHRLTQLAKEEILIELKEVRARIEEYESILASELEDLIADEQVAVTVTHSGYLKRTPISTYRQQRRGGTGRKGAGVREEDFVEHLFIASTHAYLLIFTNTGRVYWLKVYEVPDVGAAGKGKVIANLVALQPGESVRAVLPVRDLEEAGKHVFFATRNGTVKKTELKDFSNVMSRGIIAIGIDKGDELVSARLTDGNQIVFLASHEGQAIRFDEEDVRPMGRPAYGVRGMDMDKNDYVVGLAVTPKAAPAKTEKKDKKKAEEEGAAEREANMILSVTENGYGKRTEVDEYRLQSRGGKGVINVKTTARNGKVVAILLVDEVSEAMIISQYGKIIRVDTSEIREAGRSTQGVRLLQLEPGDKVAAASIIPPEAENGNGTGTLIQ